MVRKQVRSPYAANGEIDKDLAKAIVAASEQYDRIGVPHALCGGVARNIYGLSRTTRDIDFLVGDEAFEGTVVVSMKKGVPVEACGIPVDSIPIPMDAIGRRLLTEALKEAADFHIGGHSVPVIRPEHLVVMKLLIGRRKDLLDAEEIVENGSVNMKKTRDLAKRCGVSELLKEIVERIDAGEE